jgi:arylformamidase
MHIHDITRPVCEGMVVYPGDIVPGMVREDRGDYVVTRLALGSHSGTHIDAPAHYLRGARTIDQIPLEQLIGPAQVIDVTDGSGTITTGELAGRKPGMRTILLKTPFSGMQTFSPDYRSLSLDAAAVLVAEGVRCIGIDTPSIEQYDGDGSVHRLLLGEAMVIVELLDLASVPEGDYYMIALPLPLHDGDGSPARVVLLNGRPGGAP